MIARHWTYVFVRIHEVYPSVDFLLNFILLRVDNTRKIYSMCDLCQTCIFIFNLFSGGKVVCYNKKYYYEQYNERYDGRKLDIRHNAQFNLDAYIFFSTRILRNLYRERNINSILIGKRLTTLKDPRLKVGKRRQQRLDRIIGQNWVYYIVDQIRTGIYDSF